MYEPAGPGRIHQGFYGDFSKPAEDAFRKWAKEKGMEELAEKGIPAIGRTNDFYQFYLFRLESTPRYIKEIIKGILPKDLSFSIGNNVGPLEVNSGRFFPPLVAPYGYKMLKIWLSLDERNNPAYYKGCSELVKAYREFGGKSGVICSLDERTRGRRYPISRIWPGLKRNLEGDRICGVSALSALPDVSGFFQYHLTRPFWRDTVDFEGNIIKRKEWLKLVYELSSLYYSTRDLTHATDIYLYVPTSFLFNDLVEGEMKEANHWYEIIKLLHKENIDYKVTYKLELKPESLVIYPPLMPILTEEEGEKIKKFVRDGGTFLYATSELPQLPDGKILGSISRLLKAGGRYGKGQIIWLKDGRISGEKLRKLATEARATINLDMSSTNNQVKSYIYQKGSYFYHLFNNNDPEREYKIQLPFATRDFFSEEEYRAGEPIPLAPAQHLLVIQLGTVGKR